MAHHIIRHKPIKCWLSKQDNGLYMVTRLKPVKKQIGLSGKSDLYVRPGDPMAIKNMCEWAVDHIWKIKLETLESKMVFMEGYTKVEQPNTKINV